MKALFGAIENKGGSAKTTTTMVAVEALLSKSKKVVIVDSDTANSSTKSMYPEAEFIDLQSPKVAGSLVRLFQRDDVDFVVMDCGARDEIIIRNHFPMMREAALEAKAKIVALRPVTLGVANHRNIEGWVAGLTGADGKRAGGLCDPELSRAILFRSLACGRDEIAFSRRWDGYGWKSQALKDGRCVEVDTTDLGAEYAENLTFTAARLPEIVSGKFNPEAYPESVRQKYLDQCNAIYDADARVHVGLWLKQNIAAFLIACEKLGIKV